MLIPMKCPNLFVFLLVTVSLFGAAYAHGRLINPPGRSSMWRFGFQTPKNYNDNELFCGGFSHQQSLGGKCGLCGDPYDQSPPRENEAGGKYAKGIISRRYRKGSQMDITIQITANHLGYFEFRLCDNNDVTKPITNECLKHLLVNSETKETKHPIGTVKGNITITVDLPQNLTCSQCVIQWRYHTGNSWGNDETGQGVGYGPQEEFYACADIAIFNEDVVNKMQPSITSPAKEKVTTLFSTKGTPTTMFSTKGTLTTMSSTTATPTTMSSTKATPTLSSILKLSTSRESPTFSTKAEELLTSTKARPDALTTTTMAQTKPTTPLKHTQSAPPSPSSDTLSCVSLSLVTTDFWCNSSCNHVPPYCPPTVCHCS
ncbi:uncharacterized protein LOC132543673 [Ylistrum balloti]|uniref:uncharacterized protein LOC132543673 n=1 Tax=Ylistrum balloti TaxID=509963 RepID=UPI00290590F3|nr:uncharacterized protein LOC132543673 [Ylistrum balloti]